MPCVIDISELQYNYYGIVKWRQTENEVLLGLRSQPQPGADAPALPQCPCGRVYIFIRCAPGLPWFQERLLFDHGFSAALVPVYGGLRGL